MQHPKREPPSTSSGDNAFPSLLTRVSQLLAEEIQQNEVAGLTDSMQIFDGPPLANVDEYLAMMMRRQNCSPSCAIVALVYIKRLKDRIPQACVNSHNIRLLLLTAMMMAAKFTEDDVFNNKDWAAAAGISFYEVNRLELFMLATLEWRMSVSHAEFLLKRQHVYPQDLRAGLHD
jgi:hypothetical protein